MYQVTEWIALQTIVVKEVRRFMRIWVQTLIPPGITMILYFVVFGNLIGSRLGQMQGVSYIEYIVPGLVMMSVITNAYSNVASSFFSSKFQKCIEELLVSPIPNSIILLGYVLGGVFRGALVGMTIMVLSLFFVQFTPNDLIMTFLVLFLTASLFAMGGFINALFAKKFDDISIVPTFILAPLTYLGGVFYSIDLFDPFWRTLSLFNPIVYMVNAFRYGLLGITDVNIGYALAMILIFNLLLFLSAMVLLHKGVGVKH